MPVLSNPKHELFAQALAKGRIQVDAYAEAGYKPHDSSAARLLGNVRIAARVAELAEKTALKAEIDIVRTLQELVRLGTSDIRQAFDEDGQLKRPEEWSDEFAASVASIEVITRNGSEEAPDQVEYVHKIKMWDKNSALEKIAKHLGMFIERREVTVTHIYADMSDDELDRELSQALAGEAVTAH
mgnify:CR=1 FL=1